MSTPKNHHFISQKQLSYFSQDGINVFRYEKDSGDCKLLPISNVARVKGLYSFEDKEGGMNTSIENPFFVGIDGQFPNMISHIEDKKPLEEIRGLLVDAISSSYARTPARRKNLDRIVGELYAGLSGLNEDDAGDFNHQNTGSLNQESLQAMFAVMGVHARVMLNSAFWVGIAPAGSSFVVSDNLADGSFLPLTHNLCLFSSNESRLDEYVLLSKDAVDQVNKWSIERAEKYVFSFDNFSI